MGNALVDGYNRADESVDDNAAAGGGSIASGRHTTDTTHVSNPESVSGSGRITQSSSRSRNSSFQSNSVSVRTFYAYLQKMPQLVEVIRNAPLSDLADVSRVFCEPVTAELGRKQESAAQFPQQTLKLLHGDFFYREDAEKNAVEVTTEWVVETVQHAYASLVVKSKLRQVLSSRYYTQRLLATGCWRLLVNKCVNHLEKYVQKVLDRCCTSHPVRDKHARGSSMRGHYQLSTFPFRTCFVLIALHSHSYVLTPMTQAWPVFGNLFLQRRSVESVAGSVQPCRDV